MEIIKNKVNFNYCMYGLKTFKREIDNIKLGNYPQTNNEDIDGQYLRELLDKKRHEHDPDYISHIPVGETKKYKEDNKIYALLKEEHQKVADYRNFQEFVDSKIREEKSKKVPSLRLIDQYKIASSWYENLMIIKEWEMELLES